MKLTQKGGDDEQEENFRDCLQDIGDSTSFHARDGDSPVNRERCLRYIQESHKRKKPRRMIRLGD